MDHSDIAVLIPAYKPDERLNTLIRELIGAGFVKIVVVNDGSGEPFSQHFEGAIEQGALILGHEKNLGKGAALKTGLRYILSEMPSPVITADSDGQHTPADIHKIADAMIEHPDSLILGVRERKEMPLRSKLGNAITAFFFGLLTGLWVSDTQTGLRGLPACSLNGFALLAGDRYEYEMNMLINARHQNVTVFSVRIDTVYFDNNKGSHFRSVRDGARVYHLMFRQVLAFMGSSLIATAVDISVYTGLQLIFPHLVFMAIAVARVLSSLINFNINRAVVFRAQRDIRAVVRFVLLVLFMLVASYYLNILFRYLGISFFTSKVLADFLLFFINYNIQQSFIFRRKD